MESNESGANWRWVKVNGVMPTVANAVRGTYQYWVEQTLMLNNSASTNAQAVYGQIKTDLGNPSYITGLNSGFTQFTSEAAGSQLTGIIALPNPISGLSGGACSAKFAGAVTPDADAVNVATKAAGGLPDSSVKPAVTVCPPRF
jgi:hypothetical protein